MKRAKKWTIWLIVLAAVLLIIKVAVLPTIVGRVIASKLQAIGFHEVSLNVQSVSPWSVEVQNLAMGRGEDLQVANLSARGDFGGVIGGHLGTIDMSGAQFKMIWRDGRIDWSSLIDVSGESGQVELPFDRIVLRGCTLVLDVDGRVIRLPLQGNVINQGAGRLNLDLKAEFMQTLWPITGWFDASTGDSDIRGPFAAMGSRSDATGATRGRWRFRRTQGHGELSIDVKAALPSFSATLAGFGVAAERIDVALYGRIDQQLHIVGLDAALAAQGMRINDAPVHDAVLTAARVDDRIRVDVQARGETWNIAQLRVALPVRLQAWSDPASLAIAADWRIESALPQRLRLALLESGVAVPAHTPVVLAGEARVTPGEAWRIELPAVTLSFDDVAIEVPAAALALIGDGTLHLAGRVDDAGAALALQQGSMVRIDAVRLAGGDDLLATPLQIDLTPLDDAPLLDVPFDSREVAVALRGRAEAPALGYGAWQATLGELVASLRIDLPADGEVSYAAEVALTDATVRNDEAQLALGNINATIPITHNHDDAPAGSFTIDSIDWREHSLAPVRGSLRIVDGKPRGEAQWLPTSRAVVNAEIDFADGASEQGVAAVEVARFELLHDDELGVLLQELTAAEVEGTFEASARFGMDEGRIAPTVRITAIDAGVYSNRHDVEARGINGSVTIDRFTPLTTPGNQSFEIDTLRMGNLQLTDGLVEFRIESRDRAFIEQMRWSWGRGGVFRVHAFRFDRNMSEIRTDVFIENLGLNDWFQFIAEDQVRGTGRLHGRIPITIYPGRTIWLRLMEGGYVYTRPGPGLLAVAMTPQMRDVVDAALPPGEYTDLVRDRAIEALSDFEFSRLTFDFVPQEDDLALRIDVAGRGRTGNQQEIRRLTVNLFPVSHFVGSGLLANLTRTRMIDRALERNFDRPSTDSDLPEFEP